MSADGEQLVVLVRTGDEHRIERRALAAMRSASLDEQPASSRSLTRAYGYGFGESCPIRFELLDQLVELPWTNVPTHVSDAEIRMLRPAVVPEAARRLDDLHRRTRSLSRRVARVCEEEGRESAVQMCLPRDRRTPPEDAGLTCTRLADTFVDLRWMARRAAKRGEAVGLAIRIDPY